LGCRLNPTGGDFDSRPKSWACDPKGTTSLGFRESRLKSKKTSGCLFDQGTLKPTCDPKRKAHVFYIVSWPKFMFKPKVVAGPHPKEASLGFKEPWPNPKETSLGWGAGQPATQNPRVLW